MHFQVNKDNYFNNIAGILKESVPEFDSIFKEDDEVYLVLGEFGRFIINNLKNDKYLKKCFVFLNDAFEKGGHDTEDAIVVQIFEQFYDDANTSDIAKSFLKDKALETFNKYQKLR